VWEREINGQALNFHLSGINNQNFIMRDEQTGSWWQQVSGTAIQGQRTGQQLKPVLMDEISFAVFQREHPNGRVLKPDAKYAAEYEPANWEEGMQKMPVVTQADAKDLLKPRALIVGLSVNGKDKAYPFDDLKRQRLTLDELGGVPLFLLVATDGQSVRAFERNVDGKPLEFFAQATGDQFTDAETASAWDFSGKCVSGTQAGRQLKQIAVLKDFWFDWKLYHPETEIFTLGLRAVN
jgi:hypothetical protein